MGSHVSSSFFCVRIRYYFKQREVLNALFVTFSYTKKQTQSPKARTQASKVSSEFNEMRDAANDRGAQQQPPPSSPVPATASASFAVAAANAFANDGNFMAKFLAQQQQLGSENSSSKPATARVEDAVVTAAERDSHVKESVLKNDGSFMATFLALQHKEERLAKQTQVCCVLYAIEWDCWRVYRSKKNDARTLSFCLHLVRTPTRTPASRALCQLAMIR